MSETDLEMKCTGCNDELTTENIGGYQIFCSKCVEKMGSPPKDIGSCMVVGNYPDFKWVRVNDV